MTDTGGPDGRTRYKTGRVIDEYGLEETDEYLVDRWTGADGERVSLRDLADEFNQRVLRAAVEDAGMSPLDGEVENMYRLLTEDVSSGQRVRVRKRLEREGVDVDAVLSDFVTHQAIHTYLTKHHGVTRAEPDEGTRVENGIQTIQQLKSRLKTVAESTIEGFDAAGVFRISNPRVGVNVRISCEECGKSYGLTDLAERSGCDCHTSG